MPLDCVTSQRLGAAFSPTPEARKHMSMAEESLCLTPQPVRKRLQFDKENVPITVQGLKDPVALPASSPGTPEWCGHDEHLAPAMMPQELEAAALLGEQAWLEEEEQTPDDRSAKTRSNTCKNAISYATSTIHRCVTSPARCRCGGDNGSAFSSPHRVLPGQNGVNDEIGCIDWDAPNGRAEALDRRRRSRDAVSPKIGAHETPTSRFAATTQQIREDTEALARTIAKRQNLDTVGLILSGSSSGQTCASQECKAGRFQYRVHDAGMSYEVEVHLPGGRLLRVLRNAHYRRLIFEGEIVSCWTLGRTSAERQGAEVEERQEERLVLRIPPWFDLCGTPLRTERDFSAGRCFLVLRRWPPACAAIGGGDASDS